MTCFLSLRTQFENLGDEVINTMMLRELCARSNVVALGQGAPDWYIANVRDALGPLASRMKIVFTGKKFMSSLFRTGLTGPHSIMFTSCGDVSGQSSNYLRDGALEAVQYLPKVRFGLVGASYSRVSPSKSRLLKVAVSRSPTLAVRDSLSQKLLAENDVFLPVVPDLAFLLPQAAPDIQDTVRDLAIFQLREIEQVPFQTSVDLVNTLAAQARAASLSPCIAWQVGRDAIISRHLAEVTGLPIVTPAGEARGRLEAFNRLYDRTAVIFSNRLHGLLVAAARGAVSVPLLHAEERKVRGIFADAGLSDMVFAVEEWQGLPKVPDHTWLNVNRGRMDKVFVEYSAQLRQFFDDILGPPQTETDPLRNG